MKDTAKLLGALLLIAVASFIGGWHAKSFYAEYERLAAFEESTNRKRLISEGWTPGNHGILIPPAPPRYGPIR